MRGRWTTWSVLAALGLLTLGAGVSVAADVALPIQVVEVAGDPEAGEGKAPPAVAKARTAVPNAGWESVSGPITMRESEPNGDAATADPLGGSSAVVLGNVYPNGDLDYFSFTGAAGDRVYAATQTSFSACVSTDSYLSLLGTDGTTVIEFDNDDGSFGAHLLLDRRRHPAGAGTYYLQVRHNSATSQLRPYYLFFQLRSGSPTAETEPNDAGQVLPAGGWVSGDTSATTDVDIFTFNLAAGDTVFLSLDLDPERDVTEWNGTVGLGPFGGFVLIVNDGGTATPDSEAFFMTAKDAGPVLRLRRRARRRHHLRHLPPVGHSLSGLQRRPHLHHLHRHRRAGHDPRRPRPGDLHHHHPRQPAHCRPRRGHQPHPQPDGRPRRQPGLAGGQRQRPVQRHRLVRGGGRDGHEPGRRRRGGGPARAVHGPVGHALPAGAELPPLLVRRRGRGRRVDLDHSRRPHSQRRHPQRLVDHGLRAGPTAAVRRRIRAGHGLQLRLRGGRRRLHPLRHPDEWERGLPSFIPITTCNSGSNCWKTDLVSTYNASSSQDLLSPAIDLTGLSGPVLVSWAQRYHIESANYDHAWVDFRWADDSNPTRLFEWLGASMNATIGNPSTTINESAGWAVFTADMSAYAGQQTELLFHLDSDSSVQYTGLAVDDVTVTACQVAGAPPNIDVSPLSLGSTQPPNTTTGQVLTIANTGGSDLTWTLAEDVRAPSKLVDWSENFDGYATGSQMHGQGGWKGWFNDPVGGALTSSAQARSAPNSVAIVGASDLVHEYVATDGLWIYTAWQFIPAAFTGESLLHPASTSTTTRRSP